MASASSDKLASGPGSPALAIAQPALPIAGVGCGATPALMSGISSLGPHVHTPERHAEAPPQLVVGVHPVPSGTSVPTQLPLPSQAPFCLQSSCKVQLLPFFDGDCEQVPAVS